MDGFPALWGLLKVKKNKSQTGGRNNANLHNRPDYRMFRFDESMPLNI